MQSVYIQFLGELLGTFILVLLGNGVVAAVSLNKTKAQGSGWIAIAFGWGLAVMMGVFVSTPFSGAHLNPAVTLALAVAGKFSWSLVVPYIVGQFIGAMLAQLVVWFFYYPHWEETKDPDTVFGCYATKPAIQHTPSNLFAEVVGTAVLLMLILAFGQYKLAPGTSPVLVGALITAIGFSLGATTGYALNPARDWGPRIMHTLLPIANKGESDWGYAWIPMVGPLLGGVIGALIFEALVKLL